VTAKLAATLAALTVALNAAARVRVALWPGWVVPLPTLIVAALALLALVLAARLALALLAGRGVLPYVAVAVTWRVVGR
jgi:hypothetical protein